MAAAATWLEVLPTAPKLDTVVAGEDGTSAVSTARVGEVTLTLGFEGVRPSSSPRALVPRSLAMELALMLAERWAPHASGW